MDRTAGTNGAPFEYSEVDRRILELNHQGLSQRAIANRLKSYGIELTASSVRRHLTELRQDPDNNVQLNFKCTYRKPQSEQRWYNVILKVKEMIPDYVKLHGFKPSSRTIFYDLQDLKLVESDEEAAYTRATVQARLKYVNSDGELIYPVLDLDCFADDKSRITVDNYDDAEPTEVIEPSQIPDAEDYIQRAIDRLKSAPYEYDGVGEEGIDGRAGGYWYGQTEYVEVWNEKNDLVEGFEKILSSRHVKIRGNRGFSSLDFLNQCTIELKEFIEDTGIEPEHIHIGYFGDCDPSGVQIPYYIKKRLKQLGISGIDFDVIAVSPKQIKKYKLPLMSLKRKKGKKADDPNLKEFKRLYGENATHLNAFFGRKHITDFKKIVLGFIDKHHDKAFYDKMVKAYDVAADDPPRLSKQELRTVREEMYQKIQDAFREESEQ